MNIRAVSNIATLSRAARRLLAALAQPGASVSPDPTRDGMVILRDQRGGISLGRGAFEEKVCRELEAHDLVSRAEGGRVLVISEPGRRRLRRLGAGSAEDAFRRQHVELEPAEIAGEGGPARVTVNAAESPLDWLRRRKDRDGRALIDAASYEAGERLRRDLTIGGLLPSTTARWDRAIGAGAGGVRDPAAATDAVIAARQRVRKALADVGEDFADLLLDLCGFLKGLETIERERHWPARSAKVVIRLALRRLAQHYGLETEARGPSRSRGVRSWVAEDEAA